MDVNPEKVKAIRNMQSPQTLKEVRKLTGSFAALSWFLSEGEEKHLPFFNTLKKAKLFKCFDDNEQAFEQLKEHLQKLPTLMRPEKKEDLYLYISTSPLAISEVLVKEVDKTQILSIL